MMQAPLSSSNRWQSLEAAASPVVFARGSSASGRSLLAAALLALAPPAAAQDNVPRPDFKEPTLYVVGYAHLDTEWRWMYPQTIREFIPDTLHTNFKLIDEYPSYVFNFSGSRRYQFMQEYYPADYLRLKEHVAAGRWFPCGSSVDENDANVPSAESLIRHVLYGNRWFRRELGVASEEYMLPDCFGFPAALPSVLAHCGIQGFSTQKLTWNAVVPIPFKVGVWNGPDGRGVVAALDPGSYVGEVLENLADSEGWKKRIEAAGKESGVFADYHYYGVGDQGGGPSERSVKMVEESVATKGPIRVISGPADWLFKAITPAMRKKLPTYQGELQLTEHSAGSITSQAYMKRWNRRCELLADAAERASVAAAWLGGREYPSQRLEDAWTLVLGSQMHDILPGTSHPYAYDYAWNDEVLAGNMFSSVLTDAVGVVASALDTRASSAGTPLIVFNPLSVEREDFVEAEISASSPEPAAVIVLAQDGSAVPAQVLGAGSTGVRVGFLAKVAPLSWSVFHVELPAGRPEAGAVLVDSTLRSATRLRVGERQLENERYVVKIGDDGDVTSIFDKPAKREILSGPARLGLHYENPENWPAWNQDWADRQKPAREFVGGPAQFRVVENGPARVAVEVTRTVGGSTFVQTIRLAAGDAGNRVELDTQIDWTHRERSLRAHFPLAVSNALATYDIQTGVLERPVMHKEQYEYCSHQWFDLTDRSGSYGVSVMNDSKYGSDRPDDHTLRLTLLHTPGTRGGYGDQATQDLGRHHVLYAIAGHKGDWRAARTAQQAERLNQPLRVFRTTAHAGPLGKSFSLMSSSSDDVRISALKQAEDGDEVIVRLRELSGRDAKSVTITAAMPIVSAHEVDGQERDVGRATVKDGKLVTDVHGFGLRAFALKLGPPTAMVATAGSTPLDLPFDTDVASTNAKRDDGAMDEHGRTFPAEQWPRTIRSGEVELVLGPIGDGANNALACNGQVIALPDGSRFDRVHFLTASSDGDVQTEVLVDGQPAPFRVNAWDGFIGGWDRREWLGDVPEMAGSWSNELGGIVPGFVKSGNVAWFATHHHTRKGDAHYLFSYLWDCAIDLPQGAKTIELPKNARIKVLAASAVTSDVPSVVAAAPLFDTLAGRHQDAPRIVVVDDDAHAGPYRDAIRVRIEPRLYWRPDALRCTLDGSDPTTSSPVLAAPLVLDRTATLKATVLDDQGRPGPITTRRIEVDDTTPPSLVSALPALASPLVRLAFSEPLDASALDATHYRLSPAIDVRSVRQGESARDVVLELAAPPELDRAYKLQVSGVKDASPAHNAMKATTVPLEVKGPVFQLAKVTPAQMGTEIRDVPGLPVKAGDAWTINLRVRADKQPESRTIIAGFGKCEQAAGGVARYLTRFESGLRFWGHHRDVGTRTQLDLGRWQMITATYDGTVVRLYKDGQPIGERAVELTDDENAVRIAPLDPWEQKRRFDGEIRDFTIWSSALGAAAIRTLLEAPVGR